MAPFLAASLTPNSMRFAHCPILKFVLHMAVIETFRVTSRVR